LPFCKSYPKQYIVSSEPTKDADVSKPNENVAAIPTLFSSTSISLYWSQYALDSTHEGKYLHRNSNIEYYRLPDYVKETS